MAVTGTGRARLGGALLVVLSLVPAVAAWIVLAVWLPSDVERYRDYSAAESCPGQLPAEAWQDCLRTVAFTVDGTKVERSKRGGYKADLSGSPFWNGVVSFGDPGPLLETLKSGDRVTGTVWRGDVTAISKGGVRQKTSDEPRDEPQMIVALGTFAGLLAVMGFAFGAARVVRPRGYEPFVWRGYGKPVLITITVACLGVGLPAVWIGVPSWVVPALVIPVVAVTAWQLHQYRYRRSTAGTGTGGA
jgi:hypothetical protein